MKLMLVSRVLLPSLGPAIRTGLFVFTAMFSSELFFKLDEALYHNAISIEKIYAYRKDI